MHLVLSCLVRAVALGHQRLGDRVVMCHPMVPTAWSSNGPRLIVGIALPWVSWADKILEPSNFYMHLKYMYQKKRELEKSLLNLVSMEKKLALIFFFMIAPEQKKRKQELMTR